MGEYNRYEIGTGAKGDRTMTEKEQQEAIDRAVECAISDDHAMLYEENEALQDNVNRLTESLAALKKARNKEKQSVRASASVKERLASAKEALKAEKERTEYFIQEANLSDSFARTQRRQKEAALKVATRLRKKLDSLTGKKKTTKKKRG